MICVGLDPDTKQTGFALLSGSSVMHASRIAPIKRYMPDEDNVVRMVRWAYLQLSEFATSSFPDPELVVIEGQQIQPYGNARPQSILTLGQVAGGLLGVAAAVWPGARFLFPTPVLWKGSVPKDIHQRRILSKVDWAEPDRVVGRSHVVDAIGLAYWGVIQSARSTSP